MRKAMMIVAAAMMMAACGTTGSPTAPTHNGLKPAPPVFDPANPPVNGLVGR